MRASTVNEITGPRRTVRSAICVVLAIGAIATASPAAPVAADGGTTAYRLNTDKAYQIRTATQIVPVTAQGMNVFSVVGSNIVVDVVG